MKLSALLMHSPLPHTLFPYTTLFRSDVGRRIEVRDQRLQGVLVVVRRRAPPAGAGQDRNSKRLNSSHLGISYAVFCVKKKNQPPTPLLLYPHPGEASVTGNNLPFVLP